MTAVFALFVAFQVKHFLADYPLQSPTFFLGKFRQDWGFLPALLAHAAVHGVMTTGIALAYGTAPSTALGLGTFDMLVHATMDRMKAGKRYLGRWKPLSASEYPASTPRQRLHNKLFWNALGLDQFVHHLTHYAVIWWLLKQGA